MIDFSKLRHEWKTATLAIATVAVGGWDAGVAAGYDLSPIIPDEYRPYAVPLIGLAFLGLRKWTNSSSAGGANVVSNK